MATNIYIIWQGVLEGSPAAWQELVGLYSGLVNTIAIRVGLDVADAEDCAQQTWLTLYRKRSSIRDPKALPAWLIRTTHRRAVRMFERLRRGASAGRSFEQAKKTVTLPVDVIEQLETQAIIEIGMRQLDPRCRKLLRALYLSPEERSYREIAGILKIRPNSLGPLRSRCMIKLRKIIENLGFESD
ncbi:MAG: sigma-70 family RNA polymerase sigma factor [Candidatus Zixiibacteriota bacterium]|nr:MAG: sigma-70 family RNA polymerase sigma factor [candidate division Zixibacteria bacterium]